VAIVARNKADLEATARELAPRRTGASFPSQPMSPARRRSGPHGAEAAQHLGGLHILVTAGPRRGLGHRDRPIETVIDEDLIEDFKREVRRKRCAVRARSSRSLECRAGAASSTSAAATPATPAFSAAAPAMPAWCHMTKTLAVQLGRHGVTVNCNPSRTTRTERTPSLLARPRPQLGVSPEAAERQDFRSDSPRGNSICRMVDAAEVAFVAVFLASDMPAAAATWLARDRQACPRQERPRRTRPPQRPPCGRWNCRAASPERKSCRSPLPGIRRVAARAASRLGVRSVRVVPGWMQLTVTHDGPAGCRVFVHVHQAGIAGAAAEIAGVAGLPPLILMMRPSPILHETG